MNLEHLLLKCGLLDTASLGQARALQLENGGSLGKAIAVLGVKTEEEVAATVARELNLEYLPPGPRPPSADCASSLPRDLCRKYLILPLSVSGKRLSVAAVNPLDSSTLQLVEFQTNKSVTAVVASETTVLAHLAAGENAVTEGEKNFDWLHVLDPSGEIESLTQVEYELASPATLARDTTSPPVVRLVNVVLSEAVSLGASDIHLEPQDASLQVRYRVDGLLRDALKIPSQLQAAMISRLKLMSGADISERRKPQDGRMRLRYDGRKVDLRLSTLPTQFGEKVVIRLLDSGRGPRRMSELDLSPEIMVALQSLLERPQGMLLVTGPTSSGKTSTLYSALDHIKSPTSNIITVEDPIEIQLSGVNQVQVNPRGGVTFALGLRAILRQDPNIILVGEIRDSETAGIACEAAQTGHLLLSTIHTNDAIGTISRLFDLQIEPFLVASSLIGVVAQRLVRRLCPSCKSYREPSPEALEKSGALTMRPDQQWFGAVGCPRCANTGFAGRLGIHELLVITDDIRELISGRATEQAIRKVARQHGMRTLMEDGVAKAAAGQTTLEEIVRVVSSADSSTGSEATLPATVPMREAIHERTPGPTGQKLRVLVVEDSSTICTVVKYFLELDGFDVAIAEDGLKGLEMARRDLPDLIISDIGMPGLDGLSMLRAIRGNPATEDIPIVILTAEKDADIETQGLEDGADDYMRKPVDPRRLAARAKAAVTRGRRRQGEGNRTNRSGASVGARP